MPEEITIVCQKTSSFEIKMMKKLKKKGYDINRLTLFREEKNLNLFKKNLFILDTTNPNRYRLIVRFALIILFSYKIMLFNKEINHSIIIAKTDGLDNFFVAIVFFIIKNSSPRIYFPYDIAYFRFKNYKIYPFNVRWSEVYNFRHCDGIIHKGPKDELKYLPESFKALEKPSIQFLPYCDEESFVPIDEKYFNRKLSKKDDKTHLVYAGGVKISHGFDYLKIFKMISKNFINIHIYATNYDEIINKDEIKFLSNDNFFHLHRPVFGNTFQKEISKYDYGFHMSFHNFNIVKKIWPKTVFCSKISNYLESGLPIITCRNLSFISKIVEKNKIGISVKQPSEIIIKLKSTNSKDLAKNVNIFRESFSMKENFNKLVRFINKIKKQEG